jgi:hypothetical protein
MSQTAADRWIAAADEWAADVLRRGGRAWSASNVDGMVAHKVSAEFAATAAPQDSVSDVIAHWKRGDRPETVAAWEKLFPTHKGEIHYRSAPVEVDPDIYLRLAPAPRDGYLSKTVLRAMRVAGLTPAIAADYQQHGSVFGAAPFGGVSPTTLLAYRSAGVTPAELTHYFNGVPAPVVLGLRDDQWRLIRSSRVSADELWRYAAVAGRWPDAPAGVVSHLLKHLRRFGAQRLDETAGWLLDACPTGAWREAVRLVWTGSLDPQATPPRHAAIPVHKHRQGRGGHEPYVGATALCCCGWTGPLRASAHSASASAVYVDIVKHLTTANLDLVLPPLAEKSA